MNHIGDAVAHNRRTARAKCSRVRTWRATYGQEQGLASEQFPGSPALFFHADGADAEERQVV